ncbi:MAG: hypothetical protein NC347_00345 [Clostridium sp.]|nr:hypothetical protein [Clostridium sp.]
MGLVIEIQYCSDWHCVFFVQCLDEEEAKEKAFQMFKQDASCCLPDTLEEAIKDKRFYMDERFYIEVLAKVDQIIL